MAKFVFNLTYRNSSGELINDENVWINARDKFMAMWKVKSKYPEASDYTLITSR